MTERRETIDRANEGYEVAADVFCLPVLMVNVCLIGQPGAGDRRWTLVDAGLMGTGAAILEAAERRFGDGRPAAIILTHGHFDHVGALPDLLARWDVPVYAHAEELPYLTGRRDYPAGDPTVGGGMMASISPAYPHRAIDLGERVRALPDDGSVPTLSGWRWIATPGHTPGQVALFRDDDRVLIAGDAFITVNQESALDVISQRRELNGPPAYFTTDWEEARESVRRLSELQPEVVAAGHGVPMRGEQLRRRLAELARQFDDLAVPEHGRYVDEQPADQTRPDEHSRP